MICPYEWFSKKMTTIGPDTVVAVAGGAAVVVTGTGTELAGLGAATDGLDPPPVAGAAQDAANRTAIKATASRVMLRWYAPVPSYARIARTSRIDTSAGPSGSP